MLKSVKVKNIYIYIHHIMDKKAFNKVNVMWRRYFLFRGISKQMKTRSNMSVRVSWRYYSGLPTCKFCG